MAFVVSNLQPRQLGMRRYPIASALACFAICVPAFAGYDEGIAAFRALDYGTAVENFTPLAEAGDVKAMYYLACIHNPIYEPVYVKGFADIEAAKRWYKAASDAGDPYSMYHLGKLLYMESPYAAYGIWDQAFPLLKARVEAGDGLAAFMASRIRPGRHGTIQLLSLSRELLEVDARKGDATAQLHLANAYMHSHGFSVRTNYVRAYAWASVALRNGNEHARFLRYGAASLLDKSEHSLADRLARLLIQDPASAYLKYEGSLEYP